MPSLGGARSLLLLLSGFDLSLQLRVFPALFRTNAAGQNAAGQDSGQKGLPLGSIATTITTRRRSGTIRGLVAAFSQTDVEGRFCCLSRRILLLLRGPERACIGCATGFVRRRQNSCRCRCSCLVRFCFALGCSGVAEAALVRRTSNSSSSIVGAVAIVFRRWTHTRNKTGLIHRDRSKPHGAIVVLLFSSMQTRGSASSRRSH